MDTDIPGVVSTEAVPSAVELVAPAIEEPRVVEPVIEAPKVVVSEVRASDSAEAVDVSQRGYPSLYDTKSSTVVAILLGMLIVGGIQTVVWQIHQKAKTEYSALTQFVTMMVALVLGAYMADLLIAGPDTSLLSDDEHTIILGFVKDICLMVFSYYFGTRSASSRSE